MAEGPRQERGPVARGGALVYIPRHVSSACCMYLLCRHPCHAGAHEPPATKEEQMMPSRKIVLALIAGAGLILLLGACKPTCTVDQLQAPINLDPDSELDVLDPANLVNFTWGYPASDCEPDFFE